MDWTEDIESILECIRENSVILHLEHKKEYFKNKNSLKYYRIPIIILSAISSIVSVGLTEYLNQKYISLITCLLSLICSIIASIELFLGIQKKMEIELAGLKNFYLLSIEIQKVLSMEKEIRPMPAKEYLETQYNTYVKLYDNTDILIKNIGDKLTPKPVEIKRNIIDKLLSSSNTSSNSSTPIKHKTSIDRIESFKSVEIG